jgi:hypothetical protein
VQAATAPDTPAGREDAGAAAGYPVELTHAAGVTAGSGGRLRIPVKVSGNGKPGHVILNLAVDIQILTEEDDKTV